MTTVEAEIVAPASCNLDGVEGGNLADQGSGQYSVALIPGSRIVVGGFTPSSQSEDYLMFINVGGEIPDRADSFLKFREDVFYQGGEVLRTNEQIVDGGDYSSIYQSTRLGDFSYRIPDLPPGEYLVDLHFVEIIFTNGPKGMRVFNVFVQDEKVLSDFDIYGIVGTNKPVQLADLRVVVLEDGILSISLVGVTGSPLLGGICIKKAPKALGLREAQDYVKCENCSMEIEIPKHQKRIMQSKFTAMCEKEIKDLSIQCKRKTDECYEAWMSLAALNEELRKVRMELDNKTFEKCILGQTVEEKDQQLQTLSKKYEDDKCLWSTSIIDLGRKLNVMKREHSALAHEAHECASAIPDLNNMLSGVQALVAQCEDLKFKYGEEQAKRRKLYNQLQETKGNIRVFCRCRPPSKEEASAGCATVVDFDFAKDGDLGILTTCGAKKTFRFDRVYTPKDCQVDVFADASPLIVSVLDGYNVCIFAYGQTGTGKTFTMEGTEQNRGVNYRTLEQLFQIAKERKETHLYEISVSVLEVYNEQIRDLLATSPSSKKLEIKQASEGFHNVPGVVEAKVQNIREVWNVLQVGSNARAVGSNNVNEHSSRSHCMLCIMVKSKNLIDGECTRSKLWLVDLAGSERLAKTDAQGERLKEAQNINRSLSALGDVISALANKSSHIPYRNSKLTHLLQDSLGGDSKTLMFVQISPLEKDLGETLSSLNFATRVRGVELGPAKKQADLGELQKTKTMLEKSRQECRSKDEYARKLEESLQSLETKAKVRDQSHKSQLERIRELENQLQLKSSSHDHVNKQNTQLYDNLKGKEEICLSLQHKVKELESRLRERESSESVLFQEQMKNLEGRHTKREEELENHSRFLQQKITELERKLKEKEEQHSEIAVADRKKMQELEKKLKEMEQLKQDVVHGATPIAGRTRSFQGENESSVDPCILTASCSVNRPALQERGAESTCEPTRKRISRGGDSENQMLPSLNDKRGRKSDPPPRPTRVIRTTKPPMVTGSRAQGTIVSSRRLSRDVQGPGDKENKRKIWS
ncbi:hypothetical protein MLD38_031068 [Melastoma candidum]|uniref:Uncharacterized protein n=1 Tax=Melastoma candidum TaxID=119954 RepID=A0ACB9MPU0_9MYRT|nr:hypothetical protein MLD38_031068 [Melastoma candidum]